MSTPRPLLSTSWYRVAALTPLLRTHVQVRPQRFRGESWFVVTDPASGKSFRLTPEAHRIVAGLDGKATLESIWAQAQGELQESAPTQDEVINLLGQLHSSDLLQGGVSPDTAELFDRYRRTVRRTRIARFANPMALRFPLWDPDRFLQRYGPWVRWFFGPVGIALWLMAVVPAAVLALMHYAELTENISDRVLSTSNLVMLWCIFPVVKALHELGHGFAARLRGGEVHEMGLMFLVLAPVPYVDASSASAFPSKWRRAMVGVAGMWVEVFISALAFYVWWLVEPGLVRAIAFNVMLIGGVSTVLFNGNPLLRYDGYFVLCDLIEMPNLGGRANTYLTYLLERHVYRLRYAERPLATTSERVWYVCYAPLAFVYRLFVAITIALFVATQFFFVGVAMAIWSMVTLVGVPLYKSVRYLVKNPRFGRQRGRALGITAGVLTMLGIVVIAMPMPHSTRTEGVVWLPDDAFVRAGSNGFVTRIIAVPGQSVRRGDVLVECENAVSAAELRVLEARAAEAQAKFNAQWGKDKVETELARRDMDLARSNLERARERIRDLTIRSVSDGIFNIPGATDLPGRFVRKGESLGYVVAPRRGLVRVVLPQDHVDLVRQWTRKVEVKLTHQLAGTVEAYMMREVPSGAEELPSAALGTLGGGVIATDPSDQHGRKALARVFQLDVQLPEGVDVPLYGGRVYVKFQHQPEPLGRQMYRGVRQLLLRQLNV